MLSAAAELRSALAMAVSHCLGHFEGAAVGILKALVHMGN